MSQISLSGLYRYPVKSAAGIALAQATVATRGLQHDRRWMIVDDNGKFMTQRQYPRMALIQVALQDTLTLSAPGMADLQLPLQPPANAPVAVEVWGDRCQAISLGALAQTWLSDFLGIPCQLVYMPEDAHRPVDHGALGETHLVSFADAYPFLLISEASLADLNRRLSPPIPMNRFRPNLVVQGCEAFAEDAWQQIQIGPVTFTVAKPCRRCSIPGIDQATAIPDQQTLPTLATFRRWDNGIWFGQNLVQQNLGHLQLGDPVKVLAVKEPSKH
jgi:hypothetical protein